MIKFFKKIFTPKEKIKSLNYNTSLVTELYKLYYDVNLELLITDPVNKLYIINVYFTSLFDLLDNVVIANKGITELTSINLYSYFKYPHPNVNNLSVKELLKRLIHLIEKNTISKQVENDILELITAYNYLKDY